MVEDEHILLTQLTSVKKKPAMSMMDFIATSNKTTSRIPIVDRLTISNLKTFFISVMPPNINYDLRKSHPIDLLDAQKNLIKFENDLILAENWKRGIQTKGSSSNTSSSDEMIQKFSNELVAMKRKLPRINHTYQ